MRRVMVTITVLVCLAVAGMVSTAGAATPAPVSLVAHHASYRAGQEVQLTVVNRSAAVMLHSYCLALRRATARGWVTITQTHGVSVGCGSSAGVSQPPHSRQPIWLALWDDLVPGRYEVTLRYKPANHGRNLGNLTGPRVRSLSVRLSVRAFAPRPKPHLREARLLSIARQAAADSGDSAPTLIQHVEATRFNAVRISAGGDLVFAWNWTYLIAIRGHFTVTNSTGPPGSKPPHGTVLTLVVDAATGQGLDFGLDNHYPPLAELGPVTTDLRAAP